MLRNFWNDLIAKRANFGDADIFNNLADNHLELTGIKSET